ncbi:hypothetical protein MGU_11522 [Metarhizium guizhouense ARSEF 977]|uniref:Uncharacterized protein n=1 Tax=Metarhizium guizhouense (strain ARSEF 977) TaxID=1276136 RepID=A0A0B4HNU6_METGA|nr:hypothetical protein MGU_11522 [Metarhizium guizhouense ARSEF 977]
MSIKWEVTYFTIGATDLTLFANGRMQVAANILIKAVNPADNKPYTLTASDLGKIELVDYYNTGTKLGGGWTYTATENEFAHSMPGSKSSPNEGHEPLNNQAKKYWVSTTKIESKSIGARIPQPNGRWINTHSDDFDSHINLRGTQPVHYNTDNTNLKRDDTANGGSGFVIWDQDNYYLTSKNNNHAFKKAELHGYRNENYKIEGMRWSIGYWRDGVTNYIHYFWEMGTQKRVKAGLTHYEDGRPFEWPAAVDITVRENRQALCFTRLRITSLLSPYSNNWVFNSWFRIFDIYGNTGDFSVNHNERNLISIKNRGTSALGESEPNCEDEVVHLGEKIPEGDASDIPESA